METTRTQRTSLGEALDRIQAAFLELSPLREISDIAETALGWELDMMSSEAAFIRVPDVDLLSTRTANGPGTLGDDKVRSLLRQAADLTLGERDGSAPEHAGHACIHALQAGGRTFGLTGVMREKPYNGIEQSMFAILAAQIASVMEVARLKHHQGQTSNVLTTLRAELERTEHERELNAERAQSAQRVERAHELAVAALVAVSVHARSGHDLDDFYRRLTRSVAELVDANKVLFWQIRDGQVLAAMPGAHGVDDDFVARLEVARCAPDRDDLASQVVFHDYVFRASRTDESKDFRYVLDALGVKDAISVPWRAGDERLGLVAAYDSNRPEGFTREDTWVLQKAALAAGLVWQLKYAEADLQKTIDRLEKVDAARQLLLKNVATAVDKAGKRFASDLHDDALQKLTGLSLHLERLKHLDGRDGETLKSIQDLLVQTEEALRRLLFEVRPPALDDPGGLNESIRERLAMLRSLTGAIVELDLDLPDELPYHLKSTVFRQVAEAVTNIEKHARAGRVKISLQLVDGAIHGMVEDDGTGFVVSERNNLPGHLGLLSLKERAILAGGWYKIDSQPGVGTRIEFGLPVA
ncbi:MAG TPA: GAF domain-containing protein [Candidatus Dormibacteraeota bacterium]